jgi:hypothetical protein
MDLTYTVPKPSLRFLCDRDGLAYSTLRRHVETTFQQFDHADMCVTLGLEPSKWIAALRVPATTDTAPKVWLLKSRNVICIVHVHRLFMLCTVDQ